MKKAAYKKGEKITWHPDGNKTNDAVTGIIELCDTWGKSFQYLIGDIKPHCWVLEEWIIGWADRRRLRDKLDAASPLQIKNKETLNRKIDETV